MRMFIEPLSLFALIAATYYFSIKLIENRIGKLTLYQKIWFWPTLGMYGEQQRKSWKDLTGFETDKIEYIIQVQSIFRLVLPISILLLAFSA